MYRLLTFFGILLGLSGISQGPEPTQTNIILFLIDDLGWKDIGCQGSNYYQTPNIDGLASSGVRFTDAYAACAVCSPTRAAVLTGKYPARLMLTDWLPSGRWSPKAKLREGRFLRGLPVEEFTLAEALRAAGSRTASIGKWPGATKPGLVVGEPVTSTDIYPTCLAAAGLSALPNQHVDGVNLQPVLTGAGSLPGRALFWHFPHYNEHPSSVPSSVIRKGPWKLIETFDPEGIELYNLADDLSETKNVAGTETAKRNELRRELDIWRKDVGAEMMHPNPDYDPTAKPEKKKRKKGEE